MISSSKDHRRLGRSWWARLWRSHAGNVAPMFALMLVPLVAMFGVAGEGSGWLVMQRAAQNAADQAALAAARNGCTAGCATSYAQEAAGVSKGYSFANGDNNTTVTAAIATTPAPCNSTTCYSVTIQRRMPLQLLPILGFAGDATTTSGQAAQTVFARAIATRAKSNAEFCITVLSAATNAFEVKGGPNLDLTGCPIYAPNGGASCTLQSGTKIYGAYVGNAGDAKNCGPEQVNPLQKLDPYAALANTLPDAASKCGTGATAYPKEAKNKNDPQLPASNQLQGSLSFSANTPLCGDVRLKDNVTVTGNSVLVIENGHLDLAGFKLSTATNASLTIVFSGAGAGTGYDHFICSSASPPSSNCFSQNGSVLDFSAPSSGAWSGVAIYQDPRLTSGVNMTASGNTPQWNITGLVYAPKATIDLAGAINHATGGLACLAFFVNQFQVNGTASIFATPTIDCPRAGLNPNNVDTLQQVVMVQ